MSDHHHTIQILLEQEAIALTDDQGKAIEVFLRFIQDPDPLAVFVLRGAAGTGKTFLIRLLSRFLARNGFKVPLLAPTGRAAKVITRRAKRYASTLHRYIYSPVEEGGRVTFRLKENKDKGKHCYIVDESSMVGDGAGEGIGNGLLTDFLTYVSEGFHAPKIIFVGDPAQLPPVGSELSPALDPVYLEKTFSCKVYTAEMTQVMRQEAESEILVWATQVRESMQFSGQPELERVYGGDVEVVDSGADALEIYTGLYREDDPDRVLFLTYSNRMATEVNKAIRNQLFGAEDVLMDGEVLMVVRNNYAFGTKEFPFIANGEMGVVQKVHHETLHEKFGLKWVDVTIEFQDLADQAVAIDCRVVLDLLLSKEAQLPYTTLQRVMLERRKELERAEPGKRRFDMSKDMYVNALQVKYGYAVTGHKAQGGQWKNVIVAFEPVYQGMQMSDYLRWTYTALTRAEEKVYVLGCPFVSRDF